MAINPINFRGAGDLSTGVANFGDIIKQLGEGYAIGNIPRDTQLRQTGEQEKNRADMLKNALTEQFGAREKEADINYKNALTGNANNPFSRLTGIPAEVYGLKVLEDQLGEDHPIVKRVKQGFENEIAKDRSLIDRRIGLNGGVDEEGNIFGKPTTASVTSNQKVIQAIDNAVPMIDELINDKNIPGQLVGKYMHPDEQALYKGRTATLTDSLVGALGLPKTNESINLIEKITSATPFESEASYKKRLQGLKKDLMDRRNRGAKSLNQGINLSSGGDSMRDDDLTTKSDDELFEMYQDPNISDAVRTAIEDVASRRHK